MSRLGRSPTGAQRRALALTQEPRALHCEPLKEGGATAEGQVQAGRARVPSGRLPCLGRQPRAARQRCHRPPAGGRSHRTFRAPAIRKSLEGVWGGEEAAARAERSGAGAFLWPLGGGSGGKAQPVRARCRADGGPEQCLAAQRLRGLSSRGAVSAAAQTGPRAAAQTGVPWRQLVGEPLLPGHRVPPGVSSPAGHRDLGVSHRACPPLDCPMRISNPSRERYRAKRVR